MKSLSPKHLEFVRRYVGGASAIAAAEGAGFKSGYARNAANTLLKNPLIAAEIDKARAEIRAQTGYDADAMMTELDAAIAQAIEDGNANARVKAIELKGKLHGLLIERVDQRNIGTFSITIGGIDAPATQIQEDPVLRADAARSLAHARATEAGQT